LRNAVRRLCFWRTTGAMLHTARGAGQPERELDVKGRLRQLIAGLRAHRGRTAGRPRLRTSHFSSSTPETRATPRRMNKKHASTAASNRCSGLHASPGPSNSRGGAVRSSGKPLAERVAWPLALPVRRTVYRWGKGFTAGLPVTLRRASTRWAVRPSGRGTAPSGSRDARRTPASSGPSRTSRESP
jgi:hypothetical protein